MKRITIGRNPSCDISFDNNMVSRNHALLNIYPSGKMEIVSMGTNGTTVNGNKISNGQSYPIKRGDQVIFADSEILDWKLVPNPFRIWKILAWIFGGIIVIGIVIGAIYFIQNEFGCGESASDDGSELTVQSTTGESVDSPTDKDVEKDTNVDRDSTVENKESNNQVADFLNSLSQKNNSKKDNKSDNKSNNKSNNKSKDKPNNKSDNKPEEPAPSNAEESDGWTHR